jgi:CBS domain-containing protein
MSTFAEIRNFLVHTRTRPEFVAAVPHPDTVDRIERIAESLARPKRVTPTFRTEVAAFSPDQPLTDLLRIVHERDVTFFPIVGSDGFQGLITGNGIMRWLAWLADEDPLTDLSEIPVSSILGFEESRTNYHFVPHDTPVLEAFDHFRQRPELEAVLITHNGRASEALLGIITIWDVTNRMVD